ncbi:unnamed protein product [Spirodela intermedia]|uniref:Ribosomal protein S4 n=1 Tax=Spirodela intermedia TaxID=51605 RepID=A0ABN7E9D1_SPIIN|nr:unnamed protein product [Spirodela intermedia]
MTTLRSGKQLKDPYAPKILENRLMMMKKKNKNQRRKIRSTTHSHFITEDELRKTVPLPKALESKLKKIVRVNLLSLVVFENLKLELPTLVKLQLVDRSIKTPRGLLEDAIIHVKRYIFVLDDLTRAPIILGCPFLTTVKVNIDCKNRIINMKYEGQNISLNIFRSSRFLK